MRLIDADLLGLTDIEIIMCDGDWLKTMFKCSECGAMIDINEKYRNFFYYHCGARMDGEQV